MIPSHLFIRLNNKLLQESGDEVCNYTEQISSFAT